LRIATTPLAHYLPTDICHLPADPARVVGAWPALPDPIKAAVLALIDAAAILPTVDRDGISV
jgi:hypothetical protein